MVRSKVRSGKVPGSQRRLLGNLGDYEAREGLEVIRLSPPLSLFVDVPPYTNLQRALLLHS